MSKKPMQIHKIILSPGKINKIDIGNKKILNNNDNNVIKNNINPAKEIPDSMKASKSNRNKLNIFHSPRNQIIKHFKESLNKTSEENNVHNNKIPNNKGAQKSKNSNKLLASTNKTENLSKHIDESVWDSLAKKNMILLNRKNLERNFNNCESEKDESKNLKSNDNNINNNENQLRCNMQSRNSGDERKIIEKRDQRHFSLDNFLTNSSNLKANPNNRLTNNLEGVLKTNLITSFSDERGIGENKNGLEKEEKIIFYNNDERIEKVINSKDNENINTLSPSKTNNDNNCLKNYSTSKSDLNLRNPETKENNSDTEKIASNNSKNCENKSTKQASNLNSIDANDFFNNGNNNEKVNLPLNSKHPKKLNNGSNLINNYYSNYNPNLFGTKKINSVSKSINISNIQSKKKLNTNKNLSFGNSKKIISEKILSLNVNSYNNYNNINDSNPNCPSRIGKKENTDNHAENPSLKELENIICSERNSLAKKKSMDKILSARKFLNVNRNPSTVNFDIANPLGSKEPKPSVNSDTKTNNNHNNKNLENSTERKTHFNSLSIANVISPHKHINLSQNFETNFIETHDLKSNKSIKNQADNLKINNNNNTNNSNNKSISNNFNSRKPQHKCFISVSHDFMSHFKNNLSQNLDNRTNNGLNKTERKKNNSKNFVNGLEKISLKSFESGSSKNHNNNNLNSFPRRGCAFNADKSEDFAGNKNLNQEVFTLQKHQESIKNYDSNVLMLDNKSKNYKNNNEKVLCDSNGNGNRIGLHFKENLELKTLNSDTLPLSLEKNDSQASDLNSKANGGLENCFDACNAVNDLLKSLNNSNNKYSNLDINRNSNEFSIENNFMNGDSIGNNYKVNNNNSNSNNNYNNQNPFPLQTDFIFEKEKSNLINLNTYTLLKKQRNKNSLLTNDLILLQENIKEELDALKLPKSKVFSSETNLLGEIDYERNLTKESALQSNIDLNVELEENSVNNLNSSCNNMPDINSLFKNKKNNNEKYNSFINYGREVIHTDFNNKSFGNPEAEEDFTCNKNKSKINDDFNSKNCETPKQNFLLQNQSKNRNKHKTKTKDLLDAIIPSPVPKKREKDKPNFAEIINDLKENSYKYSPLKIRESELNSSVNNNLNNSKNLINLNKKEKENLNSNLSLETLNKLGNKKHSDPISTPKLGFTEIRVERVTKENELDEILRSQYLKNEGESKKDNKIKKINKFDLDNARENSAKSKKALPDNLPDLNKLSAKDFSDSFIKTLKCENPNENEILNFNESPIKRRKASNNDLIINSTTSQLINENNINLLIQDKPETKKIHIAAVNGNNAELIGFPLKRQSFNINENFKDGDGDGDEVKIRDDNQNYFSYANNENNNKDFSTIKNLYNDLMNTSRAPKDQKELEVMENRTNSIENSNNLRAEENTDNLAFRKINYNIDSSNNNLRNKNNAINIINNKKSEFENLTSENKTLYNNSNPKGFNMYQNFNRKKNSNTLSTLFNENELTSLNKNKHNAGINSNAKERRNKNSLNIFAEEYKNKFTNITDISLRANFTVSSITIENANFNFNNQNIIENKDSDPNGILDSETLRNKNNFDENIFINETDYCNNYQQLNCSNNNLNENINVKSNEDIIKKCSLDFSRKAINRDNGNKISLYDLDEEMIANEIPVNLHSILLEKKTSRVSVVNNLSKLASPGLSGEKASPDINYLLTINDSDCEIKKNSNPNNIPTSNLINSYNFNQNDISNVNSNKINTFEIKKTKSIKPISTEKKALNACNSMSTKNTNFAKNKNENLDFKSNILNNILGNLIVSKKQSGPYTESQVNPSKNPFYNLIKTKNPNAKIQNSEYNKNSGREDSQTAEIKTEENTSINNLKAYEGKTRNNAIVLGRRLSNSIIDECNDLNESASLINFNFNNKNNNNNNNNGNNKSVVGSFNESGRLSRFRNSFNKKIKFDLLLKMHDYSNSNLVKIKDPECNGNERNFDITKGILGKQKNLNNNLGKNNLNDNYCNREKCCDNKQKREAFCSFSNEDNVLSNDDNGRAGNENMLREYFSNLHMNELKDYKETMKAINSNISRLNTDKSQSSKNTSNLNFHKNTATNMIKLKEKRKFLKNSFLTILGFLNGKEIKSLYYAFKQMRLLIIDSLMMEINRKLLNVFRINCGHVLDLLSKKLSFKKNKQGSFIIDLLLSSRIIKHEAYSCKNNLTANLIFTSTQFGSESQNFYNNLYKFDINFNEASNRRLWICREFRNSYIEEFLKCFFQPTLELKPSDIVFFSLNLFSNDHFIDFSNLNFKLKLSKNELNIPFILSEITKINTKSKIDYSEFNLYNGRINEFEYLKTKWRDIQKFENAEEIVNNVLNIFGVFFEVKKAFFDDVGQYVFKFSLVAKHKGLLNIESELGIKIKIKDEIDYVVNEIKKNNLIYEKSDMIEVRVGDVLYFYFSLQK